MLMPAKDSNIYVIMEIFRILLAKTWDASAVRKADEAEKRQWVRLEESLLHAV